MISEKAQNFLHFLVDKYHSSSHTSFENTDYFSIRNHEALLTELFNAGFIYYDENSITGRVELTPEGISYKF